MRLRAIEVVDDRTAASRCDEGFLRVTRLLVRNLYDDGSTSATYPCDVMTRPGSDAFESALGIVVVTLVRARTDPTLPESLMEAAEAVHGMAVHIYAPKR